MHPEHETTTANSPLNATWFQPEIQKKLTADSLYSDWRIFPTNNFGAKKMMSGNVNPS